MDDDGTVDISRTAVDMDGNDTPEKVIVTTKDAITGEIVETTYIDKNQDGKPDRTIVSVDKDHDGTFETVTESTTERDGTKITKEFINTDDEGALDEVVVTIEHPNKTVTTETGKITEGKDGNLVIDYDVDKYSNGKAISGRTDTLDKDGNVLKSEYDVNNDGTTDSITTREFDKLGNNTVENIDKNADGKTEVIKTNKFDEQGNAIKTDVDLNADGKTDQIITREFDEKGNATKELTDLNADGTPDKVTTNEFNAKNQLIKSSVDQNNDGKPNSITEREYDIYGNNVKEYHDRDGNGEFEYSTTNTFDELGRVIKTDKDIGLDNKIDSTKTYEYLDDVLKDYRIIYDNNADGKIDKVDTHLYNDKGEGIKRIEDNDLDISNGVSSYTVYDYSEYYTKNIGKSSVYNSDDTPRYQLIYHYDDKGRVVGADTDKGIDGSIDSKITFKYDDLGNQIEFTQHYKSGNEYNTYYFSDTKPTSYEAYGHYVQYVEYYYDSPKSEISKVLDYGLYGITKESYYKQDGSQIRTKTLSYDNDKGGLIYDASDLSSSDGNVDGNSDIINYYRDATITSDNNIGLTDISFIKDNVSLTISDTALDKIANDDNSHKVIVNSGKSGDKLHLDGNFTKTTETESHSGQEYVKYTDDAGNALIVDPDITVDII
ncbi:hypothetical protein [Phocoenobacter atlanticus]|uniref:hypothetical protein n=1 Tax=Phocoenobacter atlanticus TaxID=3416742 RepID=UPI002754CAEB|nr:hypothetical protein [Pasteurella atlantica]MDP8102040.1 hypothetical protein [Pasteurella atlantica]